MEDYEQLVAEDDTLVYCVKTRQGKVLEQNRACREVCGQQQGLVCSKGCMLIVKRNHEGLIPLGIQVNQKAKLEEEPYDIALIQTREVLITIAMPLKEDIEARLQDFRQHGLSAREAEIAGLVLKGKTNRDIAKTLHIALSTVKKHLYSIYGKIPAHKLGERSGRR